MFTVSGFHCTKKETKNENLNISNLFVNKPFANNESSCPVRKFLTERSWVQILPRNARKNVRKSSNYIDKDKRVAKRVNQRNIENKKQK